MGLFNYFKNRSNGSAIAELDESMDIPKEVFVEESDPSNEIDTYKSVRSPKGIDAIYDFLQADYESKGYNDALVNPDQRYKEDNINLIKQDLEILILQVKTYYEDHIRKLDFHINSRSRAGLVDVVEELEIKKKTVQEHLLKADALYSDLKNGKGITQRITLSYQRGFGRGLSDLTQSQILDTNF